MDRPDGSARNRDVSEVGAERAVADAGADGVGALAGRCGHEAAGDFDAAGLFARVGAAADARAGRAAGGGDDGPALDADGAGRGMVVAADAGRALAACCGES